MKPTSTATNPQLAAAAQKALANINGQMRELGLPFQDFEVDGLIAEDGRTMVLFVELDNGHILTAGIPDFYNLLGVQPLH